MHIGYRYGRLVADSTLETNRTPKTEKENIDNVFLLADRGGNMRRLRGLGNRSHYLATACSDETLDADM
ncbi:hypothetical protein Tco_0129148 [Tanacetum coccineum]